MSQLIISVLIHCVICFLINFSTDRPSFPFGKKDVTMPAVRDLADEDCKCSVFRADDYVKDVIMPAHSYFLLLKDIELPDMAWIQFIVLYVSTFLLVLRPANKLLGEIAFLGQSDVLCYIVAILASIGLCVLLGWLISLAYKKWIAIPKFSLSPEELERGIIPYREGMRISENRYKENYYISVYHDYLLRNNADTQSRKACYKVLSVITFIVYILVFFNPDRYI